MTHMLKTAAGNLRSQLARERKARAQLAESRGYRHFAAWKARQKKNPLVLNVHFTLFEDSATGDAVSRLRAQPGR